MADAITFDEIRAAIDAHELFLAYQPIVSLTDGRCVGAEALTRWRRSDLSILEAAEFMPVIDRTPLSGVLTYWVLDTVADEMGEWLARHREAFMSINVPPEILGRGGLEYAARNSGLAAHTRQLVLEITERGIPDQLGLDALNSVPETGARLALDDMTLSGANLALLTRLRFDFIKLDRTLIDQVAAGGAAATWLDGLSALLRTTALQVIAEGVETVVEVEALKAAGVQMAQGHYFSPPVYAAAFMRYYAGTHGQDPPR